MMKELFTEYQYNLTHFFESINPNIAQQVFEVLCACNGTIAFTGVGKSGHIAEKISKTFCSTGSPSIYLDAGNALHGDLGILQKEDLLIFISKSGESHELLDLLPYVKTKQIQTMAWVSKEDSRLEKICDHAIFLPVKRELCPFDLAPTTSTASQLIFGDIMAIALMRQKSFSKEDFLSNHPQGSLGKRLLVRVKDLMLQGEDIPICFEEDSLKTSLVELTRKRCGCLCVLNKTRQLVGVFTDGDLRRAIQSNRPHLMEQPMGSLMTRNYFFTTPETLASQALKQMQQIKTKQVTILPVLEEGMLVGLLRMHDIVNEGIY